MSITPEQRKAALLEAARETEWWDSPVYRHAIEAALENVARFDPASDDGWLSDFAVSLKEYESDNGYQPEICSDIIDKLIERAAGLAPIDPTPVPGYPYPKPPDGKSRREWR